MQAPLIIAHRGESFDAPENTLAAINLAWSRGATAVEIDIQLTKDKQIVVFHDTDTYRITGKKFQIKKTTLDELKLLDAGNFKGEAWKDEKIPTLKEVLATVPKHGRLIIEIKSSAEILSHLKDAIMQSGLHNHQIEIIAFNEKVLVKAKTLMPDFTMLWLLDLDYSLPTWLLFINQKRIIRKVIKWKLDGVNVWAGKLLTPLFINAFKKYGLFVYAWTVNNPKKAEEIIHGGIDGLTTDRAHAMKLQLKHINFS